MQNFVYPEQQYRRTNAFGTLIVEHDPDNDMIRATIVKTSGGKMIRLPMEAAAVLAGFLLSKHPAIIKGDALAFSGATRACDAIPEPDFTVIPHGHELLAATEKQDGDGDDQDMKVTVTSPDPELAKRATDAFAATLRAANDGPQPLLTDAQYKEISRLKAQAIAPADEGDLHPDQERRLTALREVSKLLAGRLTHDRLIEWAEWILNGNDSGEED